MKCMPKLQPVISTNIRKRLTHVRYPPGKLSYTNSFFPLFTKKWEALPTKLSNLGDMDQFKQSWKQDFAPVRYKFPSRGNKLGNRLLTRIRVGRSFLKSHSFAIGLSDTPYCTCTNNTIESPLHYFINCTLYNEERQTLFGTFEHFIRKFQTFSKTKKLDTILFGVDKDNPEIFSTNVSLQYAVQNFILKTKRF